MPSGVPADGVTPVGDPRLVPLRRLAYTALSPSLGRRRRTLLADGFARIALESTPDHATARAQVVHAVLHAGRAGGWNPAGVIPTGEARNPGAQATERALAGMVPAARAAFALLHLEGLTPAQVTALLGQAGVADPGTAVGIAERSPLDPLAVRSLVIPVPTRSARPRVLAAVAAVVVLAVAAPVVAVAAFGGDGDAPVPVSVQSADDDAEREAAMAAAREALRAARDREATQTAAEVDQGLGRILSRLNDALDRPSTSKKEEKRLMKVRKAVQAERARLRD